MLIRSYAKINLFLKILGYNNHFHDLESAFSYIDLYDEIKIEESDKFSVSCNNKNVDNQENIIVKIADFFTKRFSLTINHKITIKKNIPVGAGLGGGSSNGANFMKFLNEFYQLNLTTKKLQELSFNFGSDLAFFFENKSSLIRGRGEVEKFLKPFADLDILLINPQIFLSTKMVFNKYQDLIQNKQIKYSKKLDDKLIINNNIEDIIRLDNDLTKAAVILTKEIAEIFIILKSYGAKIVKMSGSGATCFAVFDKDEAVLAEKKMKQEFNDFFIKKTKILYKLDEY